MALVHDHAGTSMLLRMLCNDGYEEKMGCLFWMKVDGTGRDGGWRGVCEPRRGIWVVVRPGGRKDRTVEAWGFWVCELLVS